MSYFEGVNNYDELKKKYHSLIKQYHPVLHNEENEITFMEICNEFTDEFEKLKRQFIDSKCTIDGYDNEILCRLKKSKIENEQLCFFREIMDKLLQLPVYRKYFIDSSLGDYSNDNTTVTNYNTECGGFIIESNKDQISSLYTICKVELNLDFEDVQKIYKMCNGNVELFKRVIIFLENGYLNPWDVRDNLNSDNPIPFFDEDIVEEKLPDFNSSLVLINEVTNYDTIRAWLRFCIQQSDSFDRRFFERLSEKAKINLKTQ